MLVITITWLYYLLRYYRDGEAEVDHIDIQFPPEQCSMGYDLQLVIHTERSRPSDNYEMGMHRLGLAPKTGVQRHRKRKKYAASKHWKQGC